jgi:hypothetical protein
MVDYDKLNEMLESALSSETAETWNERIDIAELRRVLPDTVTVNGEKYFLDIVHHNDENFEGWWSATYRKLYDGLPPEIKIDSHYEYLCSMCPSKDEMLEDIVRRLKGSGLL